ncbi:hypothetical protein SynBIOSU31_01852 [Synechococcus sp. BIOS-U3-1]|nr:hypothetical protein SynBIOSU31_01852 [Synechococcus sp. BIOS-U3-1]
MIESILQCLLEKAIQRTSNTLSPITTSLLLGAGPKAFM